MFILSVFIPYYSITSVKCPHRMKCEVFAPKEAVFMVTVTLSLEPVVAAFYQRVAQQMQLSLETELADALFKLAGELSLEATKNG